MEVAYTITGPDYFIREVYEIINDHNCNWSHYLPELHFKYYPHRIGNILEILLSDFHCFSQIDLSCYVYDTNQVHISKTRWWYGAKESKLPLDQYHRYLILHEVSHALGMDHLKPRRGRKVPIMVQQTLGIGKALPNACFTQEDYEEFLREHRNKKLNNYMKQKKLNNHRDNFLISMILSIFLLYSR